MYKNGRFVKIFNDKLKRQEKIINNVKQVEGIIKENKELK